MILDFFYDANGTPYALKYNGTVYYYITNLQGDVMQLVDANGTAVASYDYDPYGKVISATGTMAEINPIRYRGYVYDTESGLYYLQSRYYNPEMGRFLNADALASTGQGVLGCNMFAYCNNNPINMKDSEGRYPICIVIDVTTEKSEDNKNDFSTTISYIVIDSENALNSFSAPVQSTTFTYSITNGIIQISNKSNDSMLLFVPAISASLAREMKKQAEQIRSDSLQGRTIGGMSFEMAVHAALYQLGLWVKNAEPTDMGAATEGSYGYDYNADWFEHPVKNVGSIIQRVLN